MTDRKGALRRSGSTPRAKKAVVKRRLWRQVLQAWLRGAACHRERALQYTRLYPQDFGGWMVLAEAQAGLARYAEARDALRNAARHAPRTLTYGVHVQWGHFYKEKNDLRRAEQCYRRAVRLRASTRHHVFLGAVLAKQGRLAEAGAEHRKAIKIATPGHAVDEAYLNLGYIHRSERRYRLAAKCFEAALRLDPRYSLAKQALRDVKEAMELRRAR